MSKFTFFVPIVIGVFLVVAPTAYADYWLPTSSLPVPTSAPSVIKLQDGRVLVFGGDDGVHSLATAQLYNPATGTWSSTGSMSTPRSGAQMAVLLQDGRVLVTGGGNAGVEWLKSTEIYDPATGIWSQTGSMLTFHIEGAVTLLPNGKVLVADGYNVATGQLLGTSEIYDPSTGVWSASGSMQTPRYGDPTMTVLQDGKVLLTAGYVFGSSVADSELYDPATGIWTPTGSTNNPHHRHSAVLLPSGKVLISGGTIHNTISNLAEIYDPATGIWTNTGSMNSARSAGSLTLLPNGKVLAAGGADSSNTPVASAETYDESTGLWTLVAPMNEPRASHGATLLDNGRVLEVGGWGANSPLATAELYVVQINHTPVLSPIGDKTINEGQALSFTLSATDPDGDTLTYSVSNLPSGASFNATTRTFSWTPSYGQAGNYANVEFTVMDNGVPMMLADQLITITVGHVNRAPVINPIGPQTASTTIPLSFNVNATDPDGDTVTLSATGLPTGSSFNQATGAFSWTPTYNQSGVYTVQFTATDNGSPTTASSSLGVVITVSTSSPTVLTQNLIDHIVASNYPTNQLNSYLANLRKVTIFINDGKIQAAINQLNAFIQKVNQDYSHGLITLTDKNYLLGAAQNIVDSLQ